jgi:dCTP deaminase
MPARLISDTTVPDAPATTRGGVLPRQAIARLIREGAITSSAGDPSANLQPASLDLTLGPVAYRLRSSFLPGTDRVADRLKQDPMGELDLRRGAVLEQNRPYLIPLNESLALPPGVRGRANPRSSTGRLDVFTRTVTDYGQHFDEIPAGHHGALYLEVVPRSFTIRVRTGMRLNQLRLIAGPARLSDGDLKELSAIEHLVFAEPSREPTDRAWLADGLFLSVDLSGGGKSFAGYRAKRSSALLDLDRVNAYHVSDFFERVEPRKGRLILDQEDFYLLVSRERVRIPPSVAAEMAAYDPTSGELRTHYAGFFDPGFGDVPPGNEPGTPAVLEVRAHDVAFALEHGQRLCKLTYEWMSEAPDLAYGTEIGSRYQRQYLALGRQFRPDPKGVRRKPMTAAAQEPLPLQEVAQTVADALPLGISARD